MIPFLNIKIYQLYKYQNKKKLFYLPIIYLETNTPKPQQQKNHTQKHLILQQNHKYNPKHTPQNTHPMQLSKYLDPFSIPTQLNNLCVLIVAYVAHSSNSQTACHDPSIQAFLYFILYGSTIVCSGTFILSILYMLGVIDYCINKICLFGEVCLTLNTLGIFLAGIIYHCIATVYGLKVMIGQPKSRCIQLQMFKQITGIIYAIWILGIILFIIFLCLRSKLRNKYSTLNQRFVRA